MPNKPLEKFTLNDWLQARQDMSSINFAQLKKDARAIGLPIPLPVRGRNTSPVVKFDFSLSTMAREVRISDIEAVNRFKKNLQDWSDHLMSDLRSRVTSMGLVSEKKTSVKLRDSFETYIKLDDEYHVEPVRVGIRFARHGVFLHYGAGTGYGGKEGSRWIDRLGYSHTTNPKSLGKAGTGTRPARDWFNPVLEYHMKELADIASDYSLDMAVDFSKFYLGY
jgi:hypothetical protein